MFLVDTSVLIDFFKGVNNSSVRKFESLIQNNIDFGITSFTYQEVLQGALNYNEFEILKDYLATQRFYEPKSHMGSFEEAAKIYFQLIRKGITIRSTIDCLICQIAIENNLVLLHNDSDFNLIAKHTNLKEF
ncbi:MAG: PIN domain nuclease [Melioribacteraceae bacterium]|nr:PIN domain nuclease [Melioribacteraceae bacterium]